MLLVRDDVSLATGSAGDLSQPRRSLPTRVGGRSAFLSGMLRMQVQGCLWPRYQPHRTVRQERSLQRRPGERKRKSPEISGQAPCNELATRANTFLFAKGTIVHIGFMPLATQGF